MKNKICTECGHIGKPIPQAKSSFAVDLVIWLYFVFLVAMSQILPLLIIPATWTIYHLLRFNNVKCPECESLEMVSLHSHAGKEMLDNPHQVEVVYRAQ